MTKRRYPWVGKARPGLGCGAALLLWLLAFPAMRIPVLPGVLFLAAFRIGAWSAIALYLNFFPEDGLWMAEARRRSGFQLCLGGLLTVLGVILDNPS
jgi:hypothetical protein